MFVSTNKKNQEKAISFIAKEDNISKEDARLKFNSLSQKKRRKITEQATSQKK